MKQTETSFKENVMTELRKIPDSWFFKNVAASIRGIPDICGHVKGHAIFLELKTDTGKMSKLQEYTGGKILRTGGYFRAMKPSNYRQILDELKAL